MSKGAKIRQIDKWNKPYLAIQLIIVTLDVHDIMISTPAIPTAINIVRLWAKLVAFTICVLRCLISIPMTTMAITSMAVAMETVNIATGCVRLKTSAWIGTQVVAVATSGHVYIGQGEQAVAFSVRISSGRQKLQTQQQDSLRFWVIWRCPHGLLHTDSGTNKVCKSINTKLLR